MHDCCLNAMTDFAVFLDEMERKTMENRRVYELVSRYQADMPTISAQWDLSLDAVRFNDISQEILADGISVYSCDMETLCRGLFDPSVYDAKTIWGPYHSKCKIAKVIEAWEKEKPLSPLFLVKHGTKDLGLVADGKHRLTVSRAIGAMQVPFMVCSANRDWVRTAFPDAVLFLPEIHVP